MRSCRYPRLLSALMVALLVGCGVPLQHATDAAVAPPRTLALLVGIDEYEQPEFGQVPRLAGAENDVRRVRDVLVERCGFTAADVRMLCGSAATHEGIVRAFDEHLLQRAGPGTRVVFWFSGHGSRALDLSGVETSKTEDPGSEAYDNSLLAWDSRAEDLDGSFDLVDDELHSLLRALTQRTDQVLVVTDCCHSSGAVRGGADPAPGVRTAKPGRRGLARDAVQAFWPRGVTFFDDDDEGAEPLGRFPYVHIAACAAHQEAGELRVGRRTFGTLTWFLTDALEQLTEATSWRELVERVRARVAGCGTRPDQIVEAAGELDRVVFATTAAAPLHGFRVDQRPEGLCIDAGRVHGLVDGAEFAILRLADGATIGRAKACAVAAAWCVAHWSAGDGEGFANEALRAVPLPQATTFSPLRVSVEDGLAPDLLEDVAWAVCADAASAEYRLRRAGDGAVLVDLEGRAVRPVPLSPADLTAALFRECTFRGLWEAAARPSAFPVALEVVPADPSLRELARARNLPLAEVEPLANGSHACRVRAVPMSAVDGGSLLNLVATNQSDRDLRLTIVSVSEDRAVNIVWPRRSETDRILRSGASQTVPVLVGPAVDWSEPRPMVDRYLAFATMEPADFTAFTSAAPVWSPSRGSTVPSFLRALLGDAGTTRGNGADAAAATGFGLAFCDLLLLPAVVDGATSGR